MMNVIQDWIEYDRNIARAGYLKLDMGLQCHVNNTIYQCLCMLMYILASLNPLPLPFKLALTPQVAIMKALQLCFINITGIANNCVSYFFFVGGLAN